MAGSRLLVAVGIVAGLALLWHLLGDYLVSAPTVAVAPVAVLRASADSPTASPLASSAAPGELQPLFQASGWVEAAPFPHRAVFLESGFVDEVHVLEGQPVQAGQALATLNAEEAQIAHREAQAAHAAALQDKSMAEAERSMAAAGIQSAEARVAAANARLLELQDTAQRFAVAGSQAVTEGEARQAVLREQTQEAEIKVLQASLAEARAALAQRDAAIARADERIALALTRMERTQLALERMTARSPVDGIIQRLLIAPGQRRMVQMDEPESATAAIIFQPDSLQARIDVPLDEAAGLRVGQPVRLRSSVLPDAIFIGTVTRIVGEADLQRNTLQVKVGIENPDTRLRPEMLCRAEFFPADSRGGSEGSPATANGSRGGPRVYAPVPAIMSRSGNSAAAVWRVAAATNRLELREVVLASEVRDGHQLVLEGLVPGDRLVVNPAESLEAGMRVRPVLQSADLRN